MCEFRQLKKKLINDFYTAEVLTNKPRFSNENYKSQGSFASGVFSDDKFKSENNFSKKYLAEIKENLNNMQILNSKQELGHNAFLNNRKFDARFIWGSLIVKLRQQNHMTLHTVCGEIRDLKFEKNVINVFVKEEYLYNILKKEDNCATLTKLLREIDQNLSLNFMFVKKTEDKALKNLEILKNIFGNDLILK